MRTDLERTAQRTDITDTQVTPAHDCRGGADSLSLALQ